MQLAAELASYKETRRAAAFKELSGQLDADLASAAEKMEQQTAELQRLEAAVADKAAVLQKLADQAEGRTLQVSRWLWQSLVNHEQVTTHGLPQADSPGQGS